MVETVLKGTLLGESLRIGHDLRMLELRMLRIGRHDVSTSTAGTDGVTDTPDVGPGGATGSQPRVWTLVDFEAPEDCADELARALADALEPSNGWYADFTVGDDHVVVFAKKVFRYRKGDRTARDEAVTYGLAAGTPRHQLDWGE